MTTLEELEKLWKVWLTSENEDDAFAFADACGNALPGLLESARRVERLEAALRLFLEDERFHVSVGGNPIAIEQMIGQARALLKGT